MTDDVKNYLQKLGKIIDMLHVDNACDIFNNCYH